MPPLRRAFYQQRQSDRSHHAAAGAHFASPRAARLRPGPSGRRRGAKDGRAATRCARTRKRRLRRSAAERRRVAESSFFEREWQRAYWGPNYPKLLEIKKKYDPTGLFFVHHGVGSEEWSADGFTRLAGP